jgi:hypothetical protein
MDAFSQSSGSMNGGTDPKEPTRRWLEPRHSALSPTNSQAETLKAIDLAWGKDFDKSIWELNFEKLLAF